ncbi:hypothetical protein KPH14_005962 [Odynerus spinipes]|uniref:NADH dehydrogenase [ubiquinone] 1 beta subcomplex subunit 8, mitochondrial n=1 Tax=Odynerus spinipes TaxID=1348599 RepID=A0AAD9VP43_9HYME|nr:hypothetical protein KPH14_005962 [Odynerus spinipes]
MALVKTYMTLTPKLLSRNSIKLCIRAKHKETRDYPYLWRANDKTPSTPEEIKEAAERYNLHPREYKPYPAEENYGDYPQLPFVGAEARDPNYPWDFPELRRNFGEPLHIEEDQIGEDRYSAGVRRMVSTEGVIAMFGGTVLVFGTLFAIFQYYPWFQPVMKKQYPKQGVTHYTFEPLD